MEEADAGVQEGLSRAPSTYSGSICLSPPLSCQGHLRKILAICGVRQWALGARGKQSLRGFCQGAWISVGLGLHI